MTFNVARNTPSAGVLINRVFEDPYWLPFPNQVVVEGEDGSLSSFKPFDYLRGDPVSITMHASTSNAVVFTVTDTSDGGFDTNVAISYADSVDEDKLDTITFTARGNSSVDDDDNSVAGITVSNTLSITTLDKPNESIFWSGLGNIAIDENDSLMIGLAQYIKGVPDNTFTEVSIVTGNGFTQPSWVSIIDSPPDDGSEPTDAAATNPYLKIEAPEVNMNTSTLLKLKVTDTDASGAVISDETVIYITVFDVVEMETTGISIIGWDLPDGIQTGAEFSVKLFLDAPIYDADGVTLDADAIVKGNIIVDGLAAGDVTVKSVALDSTDMTGKTWEIILTAKEHIEGIVNFRFQPL